jgi:hypothetical protein
MFWRANVLARFSYCTHSTSYPSVPFDSSTTSIIYLLIVIIKEFGRRMVSGQLYLSLNITWRTSTLVSVSLLYKLLLPHIMKSLHLEYSKWNISFSTYMINILCLTQYQHKFHTFSQGQGWHVAEVAFSLLANILSVAPLSPNVLKLFAILKVYPYR